MWNNQVFENEFCCSSVFGRKSRDLIVYNVKLFGHFSNTFQLH